MSVAGGFTASSEADGERRTSSFLHYSAPRRNLISAPVKQPLDSVKFQVSPAVFNKKEAENEDITFLSY